MTVHELDPSMTGEMTTADICAQEPIHIPGSIQPHGALVVVAGRDRRVLHLSANAAGMTRLPLQVGAVLAVDQALDRDLAAWAGGTEVEIRRTVWLPGGSFQLTGHRTGQGLMLEFEPVADASDVQQGRAFEDLRRFIDLIEPAGDVRAVGQVVAESIRAMTGFNRTLIYRFDPDWNGTVIAESGDGVLPSYLDLRFPASDIPAQARALYQQNRHRLIPDGGYQPVRIDPPISPVNGEPLDLTAVSLRAVSPTHLRYMRNMATQASMSISLILDGRLWGLISCHHQTARWVSPTVRSACDFLGQLAAQQIAARERMADIGRRIARKRIETKLLVGLAGADSFQDGLTRNKTDWLALTDATGAAVVFADEVHIAGKAPPAQWIRKLAAWLRAVPSQPVFASNQLAAEWPDAAEHAADASGLLAVSISQLHPGYIMWFRRELVHTVTWAGDPRKPDDPSALNPRTSFDHWKELVRLKAAPWSTAEVDAASDFRNAITDFVLKRAEERAELSEKLQLSNKELEAFSYSVSHDLRAPFRHIVGYAELLRDRETALDPTSSRFLETIRDAALSAGRLVDDLLAFSQLNRVSLTAGRIDMDKLVAEARAAACQGLNDRQINWQIRRLPEGWGDPTLMRQVLLNLLSNAVKYTGTRAIAEITVEGSEDATQTVYVVRDNGVGFDMTYVSKLFGVFQRLHRAEDFEGTGIGLALSKRVVVRHGGWITAEAIQDQGATFTFALPRRTPEKPI